MGEARAAEPMKLYYDCPAKQWEAALPLGNGRLGVMLYGNPGQEELQLNEETIWAGSPYNDVNPRALKVLPEVRKLIFEGKYQEAQDLCGEAFDGKAQGMPYLTAGSVILDFPGHEDYIGLKRILNIADAVAEVSYQVGQVLFKREVFTSFTDQVAVLRLTASEKGKITLDLGYRTPMPDVTVRFPEDGKMRVAGRGKDHEGVEGKIEYEIQVKVVPKGGEMQVVDNKLSVKGADEVLVYISIATNFNNYLDISGNAALRAQEYLAGAARKNYQKLKERHVQFYRHLFDRVRLDFGTTSQDMKPTDVRLQEFAEKGDPGLVALYFQFGRYLLICSSQPGGQPATLQGIWNNLVSPPWDSKYTININTEMNYWLAEIGNLPEMHLPLIQMLKELSVTGRESARKMYDARGWMVHHNTDLWRISGRVDRAYHGMWVTANAWFCQHLWDRYLYSGDTTYLADIYPIMKGACEFFCDFLVEHPQYGWLVAVPSVSPENSPAGAGIKASTQAGTTMDNELIFHLFDNTIRAAEVLEKDPDLVSILREKQALLPPLQIGRLGQLQEWIEDWDDPKDKHRHVSHLWGLYPGGEISPYRTPELFNAARTSLIHRGDVSTGWSMGWKVCLWARLHDGEHVYQLLRDQLTPVAGNKGAGGTYPNLLDAHPPFQIDGNFGCAAGIAEMLVQSHDGAIELLPALPAALGNGRVSGLRLRGGFEISDMSWEAGKLKELKIKSVLGGNCRLRCAVPLKLKGMQVANGENPNSFFGVQQMKQAGKNGVKELPECATALKYVYDLDTQPGKTYTVRTEK